MFGAQGAIEKSVNFWPSLKRLLGYLRPERLTVIAVILLAMNGIAMISVGPWILGRGTDIIYAGVVCEQLPAGLTKDQMVADLITTGHQTCARLVQRIEVVPGQGIDFPQLGLVLLLAICLYLLSSTFLWLQVYLLNGTLQRTIYVLRDEVEAKINRLPLSYFDRMSRGELLSRVTNDIDNVSQALQQTLSQVLTSLLTVIGVTAMMLVVSPTLAVIALVTIPVSMRVMGAFAKRSQKRFVNQWENTGQLVAQIEEAFTGHSLIRVFGRHREIKALFIKKNHELFAASFGAQFISSLMIPLITFIGNLNYVTIAVVGSLRVAAGAMVLGDVQAFIQYSRMLTPPLSQVAFVASLLQSGIASAERVFEVLDSEEEQVEENGVLQPAQGRVEFERVSFAYDPAKPLIIDLALLAQPGQMIAIVGPTGAGKTTLVNLIMRFYELDAGRIKLDGVDISTVPRAALRKNIGMVLQDSWLFHGTIRDNIAYGRPTASEAEIHAAAEATYVDRFVHLLPKGYDTIIDEDGSNISAGEKQLLTIARAFLADPALLILDEATSSVDTRTEVLVQRAIAALRIGRTCIVIAHRLSTIRDADMILVMENGTIVELGNHAALLAARGRYYDLYHSQFHRATAAEVGPLPLSIPAINLTT
jgi:ATP-binding cassette subfamily B multidrug efflux pump